MALTLGGSVNHFHDISSLTLTVLIAVFLAPFVARLLTFALSPQSSRFDQAVGALVGSQEPMNWKTYARSVLAFNVLGIIFLFLVLLGQAFLPLNPQNLPGLSVDLALNTSISFVTNTNWQAYSGESTLSYFSQMVGLGTQNFVSAATGIAVMAALARAIRQNEGQHLGNFWSDLTRVTVFVLMPLSLLLAVLLLSQGVVQNFSGYVDATTLEGAKQSLPMGPAASQIAIKQLGSNGGGFFGVNSAHPFENPTALSNLLQVLAIVLIPMACPLVFGNLAGSKKHGWSLFGVMLALLLGVLVFSYWSESQGNPLLSGLPFLEGKEMRFGTGQSVLWSVFTSATSNGSVNAMHSSLSPLSGGLAMLNIMLGEVVFGGVGSGVYGMFLFSVLTVFIAGLMVGRSPEFLGKKIEAGEIKLAVVGVLLPSVFILGFSALSCLIPAGLSALSHQGPHGLSEILYAFSSAAGNNGSALGGLSVNTPYYNYLLAIAIFMGRFGVILPVLALAGLLVSKKTIPETSGTFPVSGPLFSFLLASVLLIVGALTFLPALALGPIVEHLLMVTQK
jgi:potassium-transporting ATPase potassium-binding subunit